MEMLQNLKKTSFVVLLLLLTTSCSMIKTQFDSLDKKACIEYERQLKIIENHTFYKINDKNIILARDFFEKLTEHKYGTGMQIDDRLSSEVNYYYIWSIWYTINHNKLRYNKKAKDVYVIN